MSFPRSANLHGTEFDQRYGWLFSVGLFLLASLVYANSFPGTFVLDDIHIVQNSQIVKSLDWLTIFRSDYWHPLENSGLYRPLTILSLAVNRLVLGSQAWGYHLVNVLLHGVVTVLFWRVLILWRLPSLVALLAAALFAVHPIHQEVVNVIVGRSELLVALFLLGAFLCARSERFVVASATGPFLLAALLSKENAVTFLLMLPLADAFLGGETLQVWRQRWRFYAYLLGIVVLWLAWYKLGLVSDLPRSRLTEAAAPLAYVDGLTRILTALEHQWLYLKLMLVPIPLQSVYSVADLPPFIDRFFSMRAMAVLAASAALLAALSLGWLRREPAALFGVLYVAAFSITSNIPFAIGVTMAERLAYLPSLWFCAGFATLLLHAWGSGAVQRCCRFLALVWLTFFAYLCLERNPDFLSEPELWLAEVRQNPADFLGWQNVAETMMNSGRYVEAESAFQRMLALAPDYPGGLRSRAFFLLSQGRFEEAQASARKASRLSASKGDRIAVAFDSLDIAESLVALDRQEEALKVLEPSRLMLDRVSRLHELRARALNALGRDQEAIDAFAKVTTIAPGSDLHLKLAISLLRLGRHEEAKEHLLGDFDVRGEFAETWNLLGVVAAQKREWSVAIEAFSRATTLDPDNRYYQENLAKARAEEGG